MSDTEIQSPNALVTADELSMAHDRVQHLVRLCCDEMHAHSALRGCIAGEPEAVLMCRLIETVRGQRAVMRETAKMLSEKEGA